MAILRSYACFFLVALLGAASVVPSFAESTRAVEASGEAVFRHPHKGFSPGDVPATPTNTSVKVGGGGAKTGSCGYTYQYVKYSPYTICRCAYAGSSHVVTINGYWCNGYGYTYLTLTTTLTVQYYYYWCNVAYVALQLYVC
jgi:hypothetical protein